MGSIFGDNMQSFMYYLYQATLANHTGDAEQFKFLLVLSMIF
jgi:hypothetical protein